ncbi:MAG: lasso peptide biosynthesis B2 protein [Pseudomonadota bacterium]
MGRVTANLSAFFAAPPHRRKLAIEAAWFLTLARIDTLTPAPRYLAKLGTPAKDATDPGLTTQQLDQAAEIGQVIEKVADFLPFRALCLQQVLAGRRMLRRRGIPATIHLGLSMGSTDLQQFDDRSAHAWMTAGGKVINGDGALEKFAVLQCYS